MLFALIRSALLVAMALIVTTQASALDFKQVEESDGKTITILLSGEVAPGDGLKARSFIGKLAGAKPITAQLAFGGGARADALSIGRFLHQARIRTVVPAKARCISPCPL